jgi:hypothetical protein
MISDKEPVAGNQPGIHQGGQLAGALAAVAADETDRPDGLSRPDVAGNAVAERPVTPQGNTPGAGARHRERQARRGMAGGVRLGMTRAANPGSISRRTSPASIWIAAEGPVVAHQRRNRTVTR